MAKITVIGSAAIDFIVQTNILPDMGETVLGNAFNIAFGGKGANQAIALARLGANVNFITCVGNDNYANNVIANLNENKVNTSFVVRIPNQQTGSAHITLYKNENSIIVVKGANDFLTTDIIDKFKNIILESDIILVQQEIPIKTIEYLVNLCFLQKVKIILNPAPINEATINLIDKVTYLIPNEHEMKSLFPNEDNDAILKKYPNKLIVTKGNKGASYFDGKKIENVPTLKVKVVDTTGAGDTFNAAFAFAIINNKNIYESITFANVAASLSVKKIGAQAAMPYLSEVEILYNSLKSSSEIL